MDKQTLFKIHHALHDSKTDRVKVFINNKQQDLPVQTNAKQCRFVAVQQPQVVLIQQNVGTGSKYAKMAATQNKQITWVQHPKNWGLIIDKQIEKVNDAMQVGKQDEETDTEEEEQVEIVAEAFDLHTGNLLAIHKALHDKQEPAQVCVAGANSKPVTLPIVKSAKQDLRCCHANGATLMVQNPNAKSEYAKEAKQGAQITWVMPMGRFRGGKWGLIRNNKIEIWNSYMKQEEQKQVDKENSKPVATVSKNIVPVAASPECKTVIRSRKKPAIVAAVEEPKQQEVLVPATTDLPSECKTVVRSRKNRVK